MNLEMVIRIVTVLQLNFFPAIGQPVGWCISNQETTDVIEIFLRRIHMRSPEITITVVMTDDGE